MLIHEKLLSTHLELMDSLLAFSFELTVCVSTLYKPMIAEIFQARHGEDSVQAGRCLLLLIAPLALKGMQRESVYAYLPAFAELPLKPNAAQHFPRSFKG